MGSPVAVMLGRDCRGEYETPELPSFGRKTSRRGPEWLMGEDAVRARHRPRPPGRRRRRPPRARGRPDTRAGDLEGRAPVPVSRSKAIPRRRCCGSTKTSTSLLPAWTRAGSRQGGELMMGRIGIARAPAPSGRRGAGDAGAARPRSATTSSWPAAVVTTAGRHRPRRIPAGSAAVADLAPGAFAVARVQETAGSPMASVSRRSAPALTSAGSPATRSASGTAAKPAHAPPSRRPW